jgi:phosphoglycerate kinase
MSLRPVAKRTGELLGRDVSLAEDCVGAAAEQAVARATDGGVVLLENLRFHPEEEKDDEDFARKLASLADVYVNDAFGAAHRAHASVHAIVRLMLPDAGAGLLMDTELRYLGEAVGNPARPYVAVLGGAKVSDKIDLIENLIPRVDRLLIGGAMAYTFFKAQGKPVGKSLVEDDKQPEARDIIAGAKASGLQLLDQVCQLIESYQALLMPRHQLGQLLGNLLPDLTILRGFFRGEETIAGDAPQSHRRYLLGAS